jgi:hypothetical protein
MNTNVRNFVRPNGQVYYSDINIDTTKCTFSLNYAFVPKGKRKIVYEPTVQGTITPELKLWLTKVFAETANVVIDGKTVKRETGRNLTGFQLFLERTGKTFEPNILASMTFHSNNFSEDYYENPFKLVMLNDKSVLTLINVAPKQKTMKFNPATGKTDVHYTQRYFQINGEWRKSYVPKKNYCRLILQQDVTMEVATEEALAKAAAASV